MNLKKTLQKKVTLNMWQSILLIFLAALGSTGLMFILQPNALSEVFLTLKESNYIPLLLNFMPIFVFMLLVYFACNKVSLSVGLVGLLVIAMSFTNRFKIFIRNDPFMPVDIMLGREVLAIAKSFSPLMIVSILVLLCVLIFLIVVAFVFIKNKPMKIGYRIGGVALAIVLILLGNRYVYRNVDLYNSLYVEGNIYNKTQQYNSKGFLYCFIYDFNNMHIQKPVGYDAAKVESHLAQTPPTTPTTANRPHVFIIMGEAYSDLALAEGISFEGYTDPMENYKRILDESVHGHIVTPNIGGGTADTEFDVLTGINTRDFRGLPYSYMLVQDTFPTIVSVFNELGYDNVAIHPGHPWFYNRQNVYPWFGFDSFISLTEFDEADNKGMYINETVTMDSVIEEFESHLATNPGVPFLDFCVTIQNHGPYPDKYMSETNFSTTLDFTAEDMSALSNYFEGLTDADREIGRLTDYLRVSEEPAVVLYFGDHLPALSQNAYEQLIPHGADDSLQEKTRKYQTPYFIWSNPAAEGMVNMEQTKENSIISSHYLAGELLYRLGFSGVDPYYDSNYEMQQKYPVVMEQFYFTSDGAMHMNADGLPEDLAFYKQWSYYRIFE